MRNILIGDMITTAILRILYGLVWLLTAPFRLFDDVVANENFVAGLASVQDSFASFSNILPLTSILSVFLAVVGVEVLLQVYKLAMWALRKVPGIN